MNPTLNDITRPNITKKSTPAKKEEKKSTAMQDMFRQAFAALKDAETAAKADEKKQATADKIVDKFVQNFRDADGDTQLKIANNLKSQRLQDIMRPEIQRPEIFRPQFYGVSDANTGGSTMTLGDAFVRAFGGGAGAAHTTLDALKQQQAKQNDNGGDTNGDGKNAWHGLFTQAFGALKAAQDKKAAEDAEDKSQATAESADIVEYTYKPGDMFGQVLMKTGLSDGRNLWGPNGDVEYYRKQLHDQGLYGNIPVGKKIKLRRRK